MVSSIGRERRFLRWPGISDMSMVNPCSCGVHSRALLYFLLCTYMLAIPWFDGHWTFKWWSNFTNASEP